MLVATIHPQAIRTLLDGCLLTWAAAEVALRVVNRQAERGSDWTFPVVIASVVIGINLGFRAASVPAASIGAATALGIAGLVLVVAGAALRIWSIMVLGRLFTFVVSVQREHHLVERGPYRLIRHPSYTGGLLGLLGTGVALDNWLSVAALLLLPLVGVLIRVPFEEAQLRRGLGDVYVAYAARTSRLIPGLW